MLKQLNHPQSSTVFIKQFGWRFKQIRITVNIATPYNRKKVWIKNQIYEKHDWWPQPTCLLSGYKHYERIGNFQKIKVWPEVYIPNTVWEHFYPLNLVKKDPGEEDFWAKRGRAYIRFEVGGYCPLLLLTFMSTKGIGEVGSIFSVLDNVT